MPGLTSFERLVQGFDGELDLDAALDKKRGPNKNDRFENRVSKKREAKDSKFGETLLRFFTLPNAT